MDANLIRMFYIYFTKKKGVIRRVSIDLKGDVFRFGGLIQTIQLIVLGMMA